MSQNEGPTYSLSEAQAIEERLMRRLGGLRLLGAGVLLLIIGLLLATNAPDGGQLLRP